MIISSSKTVARHNPRAPGAIPMVVPAVSRRPGVYDASFEKRLCFFPSCPDFSRADT